MTSSEKKKSALGFGPRGASRMDFSGKERDKLFLSAAGKKMVDVSYLGGVDNPQDGRTIATADLDHDGALEMLVAYRNAPILRIYQPTGIPRGRVLGLDVTGGASPGSNADAIGARVTARCGGVSYTRVIQVGTGFATQNARTITLGVGACESIDELRVRWPNGRERLFKNVRTNERYTLREDGPLRHAPGFFRGAAPAAAAATVAAPSPAPGAPAGLLAPLGGAQAHDASGAARAWQPSRDVVFLSFWASWCESCKRAQPHLDELAARYAGQVEFAGVTLDAKDDAAIVSAYAKQHRPGFPLLSLSPDARAAFAAEVKPWFRGGAPPLPSALVVDSATGRVLLRSIGAPTLSDLESALAPEPGYRY